MSNDHAVQTANRTPVRQLVKKAVRKVTRSRDPHVEPEITTFPSVEVWGAQPVESDRGGEAHKRDIRRVGPPTTMAEASGLTVEVVRRGSRISHYAPDLDALSQLAFVPVAVLRRWDNCEAPHPTDAERERLAAVIGDGVTVDDLFPPLGDSEPAPSVKRDTQRPLGPIGPPSDAPPVTREAMRPVLDELAAARYAKDDAAIAAIEAKVKLLTTKRDAERLGLYKP